MTIEQRLEKLERTVRRYQLAFGILGLALLATTAIACSQQDTKLPKINKQAERVQKDLEAIQKRMDALARAQRDSREDSKQALQELKKDLLEQNADLTRDALQELRDYLAKLQGDLNKQQNNAAIPEVIRARKFEVVARNGISIVNIGSAKRPGGEIGKIAGWTDKSVPIWFVSANDLGGGTMSLTDGKRRGTKLPPISVLISANPTIGGYMTINNGLDKKVVYIGTGTGFQVNCGFLTLGDANGDYSFSRNGSDN